MRRIPIYVAVACLSLQSARAQNADIDLLRDINVHRNKQYDDAMKGVTHSVFPTAMAVPVTELVVGYWRHDTALMMNAVETAAGLAITTVLTTSMKYSLAKDRPCVRYPYIQAYKVERSPCFPSAHTSAAFSLATSVSLQAKRWYVVAPVYLWAATCGYSRMHLGVHYPSDVLVGAVVGTGSAWLANKGSRWLQHRRARKHLEAPAPAQ